MFPFSRPYRAPNERAYIEQALASGHLAGDGPFTRRAHEQLRQHLDGAEVLLTTSGTHALELAALLLELGPGDEVVLPSFTFSSTANAPALRGATLRFADLDPGTFSMELPQLEAALTPRTRAVFAMPYGGVSRDMDAIAACCAARGIAWVEDNAHGLFARLGGRPLGTFAPLAALSFHQTKNLSCGEGGALVINDPAMRQRAEILREKGTDRSRFLRGEVDRYTWRATGSSYLPSEVLAALLVSQLDAADAIQRARRAAWDTYRGVLAPRAADLGFTLQTIPEGLEHPAHVFALLAPPGVDRDGVLRRLAAAGVKATSHYEPLHRAPHEAGAGQQHLPHTEDVAARLVRLPLYADLTPGDAESIARRLLSALEQA